MSWDKFLADIDSSKLKAGVPKRKGTVPIIKRINFKNSRENDKYYMVYNYTTEKWWIIYHTWKNDAWIRSAWNPESWVREYNIGTSKNKEAFLQEISEADLPKHLSLPEWQ